MSPGRDPKTARPGLSTRASRHTRSRQNATGLPHTDTHTSAPHTLPVHSQESSHTAPTQSSSGSTYKSPPQIMVPQDDSLTRLLSRELDHMPQNITFNNSLIYNGTTVIPSSTSSNDHNKTEEELRLEFYQSYDPSLGLHTAAVLGGILVWLVLYVIYRTKIRKRVIRALRKKFKSEDLLDAETKKSVDSQNSNSNGTNSNMVRPLINPSIVIQTSPTESSPKSPSEYDPYLKPGGHECFSPYSTPGVVNEDGTVFQFSCPPPGMQTDFSFHQQFQEHHDNCYQSRQHLQLPKSEVDIPSATAQWVQNMPLAARSYQDFAKLMLTMQSRGLLAMHKPCSCPQVSAASPKPLPLLDLPNSWNKSLPVLSNSVSSQLLSAYETMPNCGNRDKDLKELLNAKRKMSQIRDKESKHLENDEGDDDDDMSKYQRDSNRRQTKLDIKEAENSQRHKKKSPRSVPNLTIKIPDSSETTSLINSKPQFNRSPVPIPVTPTVMIQNSSKVPSRRCGDSNLSISSSSSNDLLLGIPVAPPIASPIQLSAPPKGRLPSPHLLSPGCDSYAGGGQRRQGSNNGCHFSWSQDDVCRYYGTANPNNNSATSSANNSNSSLCQVKSAPHSPCRLSQHSCSFKYKPRGDRAGSTGVLNKKAGPIKRHKSLSEQYFENVLHRQDSGPKVTKPVFHHRRTLSDYNRAPRSPEPWSERPSRHHRSKSADVAFMEHNKHDQLSPTYSAGSNKNSLPASSPSPHLLQVPGPNGLFRDRPTTPEGGCVFNYQPIASVGVGGARSMNPSQTTLAAGGSPSPRHSRGTLHCVRSDSNIACTGSSHFFPTYSSAFIPSDPSGWERRHSSCVVPTVTDSNFLYCCDTTNARPSSSSGYIHASSSSASLFSPSHSHSMQHVARSPPSPHHQHYQHSKQQQQQQLYHQYQQCAQQHSYQHQLMPTQQHQHTQQQQQQRQHQQRQQRQQQQTDQSQKQHQQYQEQQRQKGQQQQEQLRQQQRPQQQQPQQSQPQQLQQCQQQQQPQQSQQQQQPQQSQQQQQPQKSQQQQPQQSQQQQQQQQLLQPRQPTRHHSTGTLGHPQSSPSKKSNSNKSFSNIVLETKL